MSRFTDPDRAGEIICGPAYNSQADMDRWLPAPEPETDYSWVQREDADREAGQ